MTRTSFVISPAWLGVTCREFNLTAIVCRRRIYRTCRISSRICPAVASCKISHTKLCAQHVRANQCSGSTSPDVASKVQPHSRLSLRFRSSCLRLQLRTVAEKTCHHRCGIAIPLRTSNALYCFPDVGLFLFTEAYVNRLRILFKIFLSLRSRYWDKVLPKATVSRCTQFNVPRVDLTPVPGPRQAIIDRVYILSSRQYLQALGPASGSPKNALR